MSARFANVMAPCPVDGTKVRLMFAIGKNQNARRQRPRWKVCERGHQMYRKAR